MSVDTRITLPSGVRLDDVADVLGIIVGLPHAVEPMESHPHTALLCVEGVSTRSSHAPEMAIIALEGPMVDGGNLRHAYYFFESDSNVWPRGSRSILVRSTPFWVAAGKRLVEFFGGQIDYKDGDDIEVDFQAPEDHLAQSDGEAWVRHQHDMDQVVSLTMEDLVAAKKHAYYSKET